MGRERRRKKRRGGEETGAAKLLDRVKGRARENCYKQVFNVEINPVSEGFRQ